MTTVRCYPNEVKTESVKVIYKVTYRGRLGMQGTLVIIGTRYVWNIDYKGDQVCLERWSQ